MLNLTSMWKATGGTKSNQPSEFLRSPVTEKLMDALYTKESNTGKSPVLTQNKKGRYGGTFAHPIIGLAYAKYLSPEFHIWCNEILLASEFITVEDERLFVKLDEDGNTVTVFGLNDENVTMFRFVLLTN